MKFKKVLLGFLVMTVLTTSGISAFANNAMDLKEEKDVIELMPISHGLEERYAHFNSFSGVIKEINDYQPMKGSKIILVESQDGEIANIIISEDTYMMDGTEIAIGATITGFYDAKAPMIMIYPAQYKAKVLVGDIKDQSIKVDHFDEELLSADGLLKLNISEDTEITLSDGTPFQGQLTNRNLVVIYTISTKSIPAQTSPRKILVLLEEESKPEAVEDVVEDSIGFMDIDFSNVETVVDDKVIEAPESYLNENGVVMVPLRAIAESLGYDVEWLPESQSVRIGKGISLTIGQDQYIYMRTPVISLGTAPELVNGRTFVPLSFFREVIRMNNAYLFEGQIVINNGERME